MIGDEHTVYIMVGGKVKRIKNDPARGIMGLPNPLI
jgi:hypothetical protein